MADPNLFISSLVYDLRTTSSSTLSVTKLGTVKIVSASGEVIVEEVAVEAVTVPCTKGKNSQVCQRSGVATGNVTALGSEDGCGCDCSAVTGFDGPNCDIADGTVCTGGANYETCNNGTAAGVTPSCTCGCTDDYTGDNCETVKENNAASPVKIAHHSILFGVALASFYLFFAPQ